MFNYLIKSWPGRFLILGIIFTIGGFVLQSTHPLVGRISFYIAIFFLGFYASKHALMDTLQEKSPNVDLLMILAALGAMTIQYESEGAMLLLIFAAAEVLEDYATDKSTSAISELMSQVPLTAQRLKSNGEVEEVATKELRLDDIVVVAKGAQIPIDGFADRLTLVNEAALTGESIPVNKKSGEEVFAGTINEGHVFHLRVNKTSDQTVFSNIIRMVEEAQNRPSKISKFIDRIESKYVITVLVAVPIFIFILYQGMDLSFQEAFYRGMVFLTVASPCALVASATPASLSAISNGAKNGVLFKGGAAMEALSTMDILYSDKTGTLTYGDFQVVDHQVEDSVLADLVYMEQQSSHPIADAVVNFFDQVDLSQVDRLEPVEEIAGQGVRKGDLMVGKPQAFLHFEDPQDFLKQAQSQQTTIMVGKANRIVGYISLADQVRPTAKEAVRDFQAEGIKVRLLTGDNEQVAQEIAQELGIEDYVGALLPEDKIKYVTESQDKDLVVGMIGDGINDAPALANADIGIAMGSGSSVAMESSDVVIVKNDLGRLFYSYKLSKKLNRIILQNVIFAVGVIIALITLNLFGLIGLPLAVVFHEGSTILVILNGLRLLRQGVE